MLQTIKLVALMGAVSLLLLPCAVMGQERGTVEGSLGFGISDGKDINNVLDAFEEGLYLGGASFTRNSKSDLKWMAGGSFGVFAVKNLLAKFDLEYNQLARAKYTLYSGGYSTELKFSSYIMNFTGGGEYCFWGSSSRFSPFVGGGAGLLRLTGSGTLTEFDEDITESENDLTYYGGGGLRIMVGKNWGFKPEFRYYKIPDGKYIRGSINIVFRSGSRD